MTDLNIEDRVKYSTTYIRSLGGAGGWRSEVKGTVTEVLRSRSGWKLALVQWDDGNGCSEMNVENLVLLKNVYNEARAAETAGVPGLVIGSNAFAKLDV